MTLLPLRIDAYILGFKRLFNLLVPFHVIILRLIRSLKVGFVLRINILGSLSFRLKKLVSRANLVRIVRNKVFLFVHTYDQG